MEMRQLGSSGIAVSLAGLGCNNFGMKLDLADSRAVIERALELGITCFDTAELYGDGQSETFLGEVLGTRRKDIVLATKFGGTAKLQETGEVWGRREFVHKSVDESLKRLRTDWIDLYQVHFPDPDTPIEETLGALHELVEQGKVRAIGSSNFDRSMINDADAKAVAAGETQFVTAQNEWSLLNRDVESEIVPTCVERGLGVIPFFPLGLGMLTGKYRRGEGFGKGTRLDTLDFSRFVATEDNFTKVEALQEAAMGFDMTLLQLAIAWVASQACVSSVITGATTVEQVSVNAAATNRTLSAVELAVIDEIVPPAVLLATSSN
jgi:aryl-alcohol dehydrogenase-like predicted oxidoreductase